MKAVSENHAPKEKENIQQKSGDSSTVPWSLIRNGLSEKMAVKKPFLSRENREERLRCAQITQHLD